MPFPYFWGDSGGDDDEPVEGDFDNFVSNDGRDSTSEREAPVKDKEQTKAQGHNKHDHHSDRENHKNQSVAAMAKETNAAGRMRAFASQQVNFMRLRRSQIVDGLKSGSMTIDEAAAIIDADIAHQEENISLIGEAVANGPQVP